MVSKEEFHRRILLVRDTQLEVVHKITIRYVYTASTYCSPYVAPPESWPAADGLRSTSDAWSHRSICVAARAIALRRVLVGVYASGHASLSTSTTRSNAQAVENTTPITTQSPRVCAGVSETGARTMASSYAGTDSDCSMYCASQSRRASSSRRPRRVSV